MESEDTTKTQGEKLMDHISATSFVLVECTVDYLTGSRK